MVKHISFISNISQSQTTDENTRSKFLFHGGADCLHMKDGLEQYIDPDIIPDFLGGPCKVSLNFILNCMN